MSNSVSNIRSIMANSNLVAFKVPKTIFIICLLALSGIVLSSSAFAQEAGEGGEHSIQLLWPYHAALVSLGLISMIAGMLTARFMKGRRWWLRMHKALGLLGASLAVAGVMVAVYMVSMDMKTYFAGGPHSSLGIVAVLFIIATPILGFMQFKRRDKRVRVLHRWSGRMTLVLMLVNVILGLQMVFQ